MTGDFLETSRPVLAWVLRTTFEASLIAALVLMAQYLLRGRVSARWRYNLWLLVLARLVLPVVPGTQYSPFNLVRLPDAEKPEIARPAAPRLTPAAPLPAIPVPGPAELRRRQDLYLVSDTHAAAARESSARPERIAAGMAGEATQPVALWTAPNAAVPDRLRGPQPESPRRLTPPRLAASTPVAGELPWYQRVNWLAVIGITWIAGAAFVAARLGWVSLRLSSAVRGLRPVRDPELLQLVAECAQRIRLRRLPELLEAPDHFGPALVGLLRPRVVLPGCVLHGTFHRDELRLILMHELAHMKRWDVAANWLLAVLGVLHWFNPFLHLAFRRMRVDREMACDELVLSAAHADAARAYGPTILKLLQTLSRGSQLPGMVGVLEGKQSIRRRIAMIARFDRHRRNDSPLFGIALSLLAGGVALTGAVRGQDAAPREVAVEVANDDDRNEQPREEAEDAAREADDESRDEAREAAEAARDAADQALQAAQDRINEIQQSISERQTEAQERAEDGERAVTEAQEQIEQRQAETQQAIDEAHRALAEVQQGFEQRENEIRQAVEEAQRALSEHASAEKSEGDESAAEALAERERELKEAVEQHEQQLASAAEERDQALKEAQEQIERATAEQLSAVQEARSELERVVGEQQNALQEATKAVEEAAAEQGDALQQLANAQEALAQVGAGLAPPEALPGATPVEPQIAAPVPEAPVGIEPVPSAQVATTPPPGIEAVAPSAGLAPGAPGLPGPAKATPSPTPSPRGRGGVAPAAPNGGGRGGYGGGYGAQPGGYPGYGGYGRPGGYGGGFPGGYPGAAPPAGGAGMRRSAGQPAAPLGMGGMGMPGMAPGAMPAEARVEDPAARDADARTAQALRRTLQVNFDGAPLSEVLSFIADNTGVDIVGDWKSLESAGVDRSASVTLNLRQGAPAEQVLTWVLRSAGGDAAGFAIDHGVVLVSLQERIDRMVITRAYPLGDLAGSGPQLENLVRDTVAPHSWRESGGAGSVRSFNGKLVVTATEPNHRQVERLLGLMDAHGASAPGGPMPGEMPPSPSRRPSGLTSPRR